MQDPLDAEFPSMPKSAMREVKVNYCLPVAEIPRVLTRLVTEESAAMPEKEFDAKENEKVETEIRIAAEDSAYEQGVFRLGELSPFTCPDCHGVLLSIKDGHLTRFRCHTGHAFSPDSLLATVTENVEDSIWNAVRVMEENMMLLRHIGDHMAENGQAELSQTYFAKAREAQERIDLLRRSAKNHEKFSAEKISQQTASE